MSVLASNNFKSIKPIQRTLLDQRQWHNITFLSNYVAVSMGIYDKSLLSLVLPCHRKLFVERLMKTNCVSNHRHSDSLRWHAPISPTKGATTWLSACIIGLRNVVISTNSSYRDSITMDLHDVTGHLIRTRGVSEVSAPIPVSRVPCDSTTIES